MSYPFIFNKKPRIFRTMAYAIPKNGRTSSSKKIPPLVKDIARTAIEILLKAIGCFRSIAASRGSIFNIPIRNMPPMPIVMAISIAKKPNRGFLQNMTRENMKNAPKSRAASTESTGIFDMSHLLSKYSKFSKVSSRPDKSGDQNVKAIHRFVSPMFGDDAAYITVKEATEQGKRIYTVEMIEMGRLEGKLNEGTSSITALGIASNPATNPPIANNIQKLGLAKAQTKAKTKDLKNARLGMARPAPDSEGQIARGLDGRLLKIPVRYWGNPYGGGEERDRLINNGLQE